MIDLIIVEGRYLSGSRIRHDQRVCVEFIDGEYLAVIAPASLTYRSKDWLYLVGTKVDLPLRDGLWYGSKSQ